MRGRALAALALGVGLLAAAAPAHAHPLGNFSTNHLTVVRVSADRVDVRYVLDLAEVPTFRQRGVPLAERLAALRASVVRDVRLTVGGRSVALVPRGAGRLTLRPGEAGLRTTRAELLLRARVAGRGRVVVRDATFPGTVGWRAVVVRPGRGTAVRSDLPAVDPTRGLRAYPGDVLEAPADRRVARLDVVAGRGTVAAPDGRSAVSGAAARSEPDGLAGAFSDAAAGEGVLLFLLAAAFGWGALHALSPGHGKAMVAAYLVGTSGTPRDAVALGAVVTVTHTIGVFALGVVTLALSAYVLPEQLFPWLNLVSGVLVLLVGVAVLRSRVRTHVHHHHHDHDDHHHHHHHDHRHHHHDHEAPSRRGLLAMGASAGIIPCPSALVVLLAAIAQAQVALGLALIVAFSLGLAATLTALGLAVVWAGRVAGNVRLGPRARTVATALPAVSATVIILTGVLLSAKALPDVV